MASVTLDGVDKTYPNGHVAARGLNFEIADGELLVLVGPSGCGKSTALRMIAGLETPTAGRVRIGEEDVTALPPQQRDIAMVFQTYALYPHMSVRENLGFGLRMRKTPGEERERRVLRAARALGLEGMLDRKPVQLSGGQRQRVALGRAIVRNPRVFLFDEPLSNLDAKLRVETRAELSRMHRRIGATMVYVTHDQEEAMTLGERVAVMRDGTIQQLAPPMEVFRRPANRFVAGFVGSPAMNFLTCAAGSGSTGEGRARLDCSAFAIEFEADEPGSGTEPGSAASLPRALRRTAGRELILGVRPHDVELVAREEADVEGRVEVREPLGSELLLHLELEGNAGGSASRGAPGSGGAAGEDGGDRAGGDGERAGPFRAAVPPDAEVAVDEVAGLRLRRDRLHLFDAGTGERIE